MYNNSPLDLSLSNPVQAFTSYQMKAHFNIILLSASTSSKCFLTFKFVKRYFIGIFPCSTQ